MPGEQEHHICLYRFSFIYVTNDLWEDAYTCPIYAMNCTKKSAIYVMEFPEFHLWFLPFATWIDGFSQPECCMLHSLGLIKNRTDFLVPLPATTSGSAPENKQFYFLYFYTLCWHAIRHNIRKSVTPPISGSSQVKLRLFALWDETAILELTFCTE